VAVDLTKVVAVAVLQKLGQVKELGDELLQV